MKNVVKQDPSHRLEMSGKYKIVMIRQSEWNKLNKFCGLYNADQSQVGKDEATAGGAALKKEGYQFDVAHTMEKDHPYYDTIVNDPRYKDGPTGDEFPMAESLKLTIHKTLPYWNDQIVPDMKAGKRVLIAAHSNSLRGIVKYLDPMSDEAIMGLNLPTSWTRTSSQSYP